MSNTYQVGNHIWLALPKGLSLTPGPGCDIPTIYPFYAGITGTTEPNWDDPNGNLEINPTWGGGSGPWPYVLDAVVPVTGALVGFWVQGIPDPNSILGPYFPLPTSDPGWGNPTGIDASTGASTVTVFLNGAALNMGTDWFPGLDNANYPDYIQFSATFIANPYDIITVNMNTQICWVDLGAVNIACPWVPTAMFQFGGNGNGLEMQGYRMLSNQVSDNYLNAIGFSGLDSGQISHSQTLRNTGYGIADLTDISMVPPGVIGSSNMSVIDNYTSENTCDNLDIGTDPLNADNPQVYPFSITRGGVTQGFYNIVTDETPSGTIDGMNVTFYLANTPVAGTLSLYLNGVLQDVPDEYSITGNEITFVIAPVPESSLVADYEWSS